MKFGAIILFIGFWIAVVAFFSWNNNEKSSLSNYQRNPATYATDPDCLGVGHPIWNC